ncbi:MAG: hypothetical protein HY815_12590 [Candidatus Riflebacteria bacterium]|nr:hypothetical protein [Candidatus Riflebacteria bacterium]
MDFTPDITKAKWARWANQSPGIGCYRGGGGYVSGSPIYRPTPKCMMNRDTVGGCCVVCREAGVARIFAKVDLISETLPSSDETVRIAAGGQQNFAIRTPYGGVQGLQAEWLLDGVNLLARPGRPSLSGRESILSVTVTAADLRQPGDHTLRALVRDTRAYPNDTRPPPAEREWRIVLEGQPELKQR